MIKDKTQEIPEDEVEVAKVITYSMLFSYIIVFIFLLIILMFEYGVQIHILLGLIALSYINYKLFFSIRLNAKIIVERLKK